MNQEQSSILQRKRMSIGPSMGLRTLCEPILWARFAYWKCAREYWQLLPAFREQLCIPLLTYFNRRGLWIAEARCAGVSPKRVVASQTAHTVRARRLQVIWIPLLPLHTYRLPALTNSTRSNNYGPYQFPGEKLTYRLSFT